MNASEFIKTELLEFVRNFPRTRVRAEFNEDSKTYFVEVVPNEVYHFNDLYIDWEKSFLERFIIEFPFENLFFITDDALVGLDVVDFELIGSEFQDIPTTNPDFEFLKVNQSIILPSLSVDYLNSITYFQNDRNILEVSNCSSFISNRNENLISHFNFFGNQQISEIKENLGINLTLAA